MENKSLKIIGLATIGLTYVIPIVMAIDSIDACLNESGRKIGVALICVMLGITYICRMCVVCTRKDRLTSLLSLHLFQVPLCLLGLVLELLLIGLVGLHAEGFTPEMLD